MPFLTQAVGLGCVRSPFGAENSDSASIEKTAKAAHARTGGMDQEARKPYGFSRSFFSRAETGLPPTSVMRTGWNEVCRLLFWVLHLTTAAVGCRMEGCWEGEWLCRGVSHPPDSFFAFLQSRKAKNSTGPRTARGKHG